MLLGLPRNIPIILDDDKPKTLCAKYRTKIQKSNTRSLIQNNICL